MYLRTRLRILILVTLLPVAGLGLIGTWLMVQREIAAVQMGTWERTRAMTTAIDAELRTSIAALEVLAGSPPLRAGDLAAFAPEAERALQSRSAQWLNVIVSDAKTGEMQFNARARPGAPLQKAADPASVLKAAGTRRAAVSQVVFGEALGRRVFAVRVPVPTVGDAPVAHVISAIVDPLLIERLVDAQRFPADWAVAVVDANARFVVRRPAMTADGQASESLRRALAEPSHGWRQGTLADGQQIYRTVQRSTVADWATAVAIPKGTVEEGLGYVRLLWLGAAIALAVCLWLAWWLARGVGRPIAALADAAPALGRGQALSLPDAGSIAEVRQLYDAMGAASARLRERDDDRAAAEAALHAASRAKDEFLAMLGHELRNPLSSLSNAAELLRHAPTRPELIPKVAGVLGRQVLQMTRLVDDLLDMGRVTAGKITLVCAPLDLAAAVRQTVAGFEGNERLAQHRLEMTLAPVWVQADGARLEQIIANLLDNALKYTPADGCVRVAVRQDGGDALLEVADTGQGMSAELVRSAFDLFVQGDRPLARDSGGLGIGLTLAQRLVQLHGGSIEAHSAGVGQGATFTVRLPAVAAPGEAVAETRPDVAAPGATVLLVEDNADAAESLVALLELLGHQPTWVALGLDGVAQAEALQPDLVLVDIGLPDIDGYEVARRIRAQAGPRRVRLVALTGYGAPEDRARALAAGFDEHQTKPIGLPELEALLGAVA